MNYEFSMSRKISHLADGFPSLHDVEKLSHGALAEKSLEKQKKSIISFYILLVLN